MKKVVSAFSVKSLRAKTVLWALLPTTLVLVVVTIIALYAYEQVAREVIQERDAELARISAARLSERLGQYSGILQSVAAEDDLQSMEPARLRSALDGAQNQLYVFDAGVVVYDSEGVALWSHPFAPERRGTDFPVTPEFDKVRQTLRPAFSDVFKDAISGEDVILVGVPIVGSAGGFRGLLAGMFKMKYPLLGAIYAEVLELKVGRRGYAYLVDGNGRVIYHPDGSQVGRNLATTVPVVRATRGETGAVLTGDPATGERVISGFTRVPGTGWGLITQERWAEVAGPIRGYNKLLLGLLVVGGVLSSTLIFFSIGRCLRPIKDLTRGAERLAGGDFEYTIAAGPGDEIGALAQQFNTMASALKESYRHLERRVAERTKELATLNAVAQTVSRSLELDALLCATLDKVLEVLEFESGAIYLKNPKTGELQMACHQGLSEEFRAVVAKGIISARAAETGDPIVIDDLSQEPDAPKAIVDEGYRSVASIPLLSKGQVEGVLTTANRQLRRFRREDVDLLLSIGHQIGVAIENARLFEAEQRRAEQFKVISEVSRQITSILPVDELLDQIARLIQEVFNYYLVEIGLIEGDELVFKARAGRGWDSQVESFRLKVSQEGITGWVAATGEPLLIPDVSQEPRYVRVTDTETRSELAVPIQAKDRVIGVLNVESDRGNAFDESDLAVLQSLAQQAGLAIEKARLLAAERQRADELDALYTTLTDIAAELELPSLLEAIVKRAAGLMNATGGELGLYDEASQEVRIVVSHNLGGNYASTIHKLGEGAMGTVAETRQPLVIEDYQQWEGGLSQYPDIHATLATPLEVGGRLVGVFTTVTTDPDRKFDSSDLHLLSIFARQAAIAIENARLFKAEQRRAEQFHVIGKVGQRITSILAVDELLDQIARLIQEAFNYYHVGIGLIEGDEVVYTAGAGVLWDDPRFQVEPARFKIGRTGVTGWVAQSGEPLLVPDVSQERRYIWMRGSRTRSELAMPIKAKGEVIGVMDVQSDYLNAFDESDLAVLQSLADQAGIAIENALLYEQAQQVAILEERRRLARDLHDSVTQSLYSVTLFAEAARRLAGNGDLERTESYLGKLGETAQQALKEMRLLVYELRPSRLEQEGLISALDQRLSTVERRAGVETTLLVEGNVDLPKSVEEGVYGIALEALNNALKHAAASEVTVQIRSDDAGVVELEVADNGRGFNPDAVGSTGGMGLISMRERTERLGGEFQIVSAPGEGTKVQVKVGLKNVNG